MPAPSPDPTLQFDIEVRFTSGTNPTQDQRDAIEAAVGIWRSVIVGDLPPKQVTRSVGDCERVAAPAMDELVDDLVVWVEFGPIDGPLGIGAWGGVCDLRSDYLPAVGSILFDEADLDLFGVSLVVHELGHALGFGEVWDEMGLIADPSNPSNGGPGLIRAHSDATISSADPDANFGLPDGSPISESLVVGGNAGTWTEGPIEEELQALLSFDLSTLVLDAPINRSLLILSEAASDAESRPVRLAVAAESWTESAVTWNTRPGTNEAFAQLMLPCSGGICEVMAGFDIRDITREWISGERENHGLHLSMLFDGLPDSFAAFHSRHSGTLDLRPALYVEPSTHFVGAHAIAAYNAAGGSASSYPAVPVANNYYSDGAAVDGHWLPQAIRRDYMGPSGGTAMTTITVGAIADMGYDVDFDAAEPAEVDTTPLESWSADP